MAYDLSRFHSVTSRERPDFAFGSQGGQQVVLLLVTVLSTPIHGVHDHVGPCLYLSAHSRVGCAFMSAMAYGRASAARSRLITIRGTASTVAESQSRLGPISCDHDAKLWPPDGKISVRTCVGKRTSERNRWVSR